MHFSNKLNWTFSIIKNFNSFIKKMKEIKLNVIRSFDSRNCTCYWTIGTPFDTDPVFLFSPNNREQGYQSRLLISASPSAETRPTEGSIAYVSQRTEIQTSHGIARDFDDIQHEVQSATLEEYFKIYGTSCHAFPNIRANR